MSRMWEANIRKGRCMSVLRLPVWCIWESPRSKSGSSGKKGKKKGIFAVICIGILVIAALLAVYFTQLSPVAQQRKAFDAATELYNSGEYADALHSFEQLGDYSNAQECVVWCKYLLGREAYNSNDWETAASYLSDIDYQDSSAILNDC